MCNSLRMTDRLLPSSETCAALGIGRTALGQWMEKGWIVPHQRLGNGAYLFTETEVARAKAAQLARAS
jgi:predicted DNA-binding transcriptional regulator AlpA